MRKISGLKTLVAAAVALTALAPAPATAAARSCSGGGGWLTTKHGDVKYVWQVCGDGYAAASGTVNDIKWDLWTAVVEVSFSKAGKGVGGTGGRVEAGRKKGSREFAFSVAARQGADTVVIKARRCLPGTRLCNNTHTFTGKL
ncbi:hypothetical protein [Microbispora triticiradicis]|uniref:Secreted protein n=2 Tax=Microbispora TaxID=2005 RepID=A0ABY3LPM8_9ACTN|nr:MULTISPECIES: hypothetical protein [Microbispora]TLP51253.1 hypothetical protein FED44_34465 [Microbispora fusca]TYB47147.1 hypothetical protein FXF59_30505 [Microbispora tritici]